MANEVINSAKPSLIKSMAGRYGVDADKLLDILKSTAFKQQGDIQISNEQLAALLVVADQHDLNPFTKEIYAFPDKKNGGVVPVVGVDGWSRIVNEHAQYNGVRFTFSDEFVTPPGAAVKCPIWVDCEIYRKDLDHPTVIREYLDECYREPFSGKSKYDGKGYTVAGPWQTHPKRMLRHKAFVQCARMALGFTGIYDEDEAHKIVDMGSVVHVEQKVDTSKLDEIVDALVIRSKKLGNWSVANQYLMANFSGSDFAYASDKLKAAQAAHATDIALEATDAKTDANTMPKDLSDELVDGADEVQNNFINQNDPIDQELEMAFNQDDGSGDAHFE